jgi:thioredoxin 1
MVVALSSSSIDSHVEQPGVAFVEWSHPSDAQSLYLDQVLDQVSRAHPEVRFGRVDVAAERELARAWDVGGVPLLTGYRDGTLLFHWRGALPGEVIAGLIQAMSDLNMEEVRKGIDGHGARIAITFGRDGSPGFNLVTPSGDQGAGSAEPGRRH